MNHQAVKVLKPCGVVYSIIVLKNMQLIWSQIDFYIKFSRPLKGLKSADRTN